MIEIEVRKAEEVLCSGGIILYPTDTIWGIGCDATNPEAVRRIYEIKQRSDSKSMLVIVPGVEMLSTYLESIPEKALELIKNASKPTTIIYPGARNLASGLVAEDGSVGIRVTSDPFCIKLTGLLGRPIVSTSANSSGNPSPSMFSEIDPVIREKVDYVVGLRQDETTTSTASKILKVDDSGNIIVIRP
ncbi:MAG: threonylcarbamoyl-AMP synthase [Bacteroidetes bacterium]|nr:threonylcarbamoyl-AMP synthase [Bacteroidota bacterium]